ncbi:MAG: hypothetical protein KGJ82_20700 [Nitrospirota bacterium]|nr:hypothetical protein [Nitrospirota bacterium]
MVKTEVGGLLAGELGLFLVLRPSFVPRPGPAAQPREIHPCASNGKILAWYFHRCHAYKTINKGAAPTDSPPINTCIAQFLRL